MKLEDLALEIRQKNQAILKLQKEKEDLQRARRRVRVYNTLKRIGAWEAIGHHIKLAPEGWFILNGKYAVTLTHIRGGDICGERYIKRDSRDSRDSNLFVLDGFLPKWKYQHNVHFSVDTFLPQLLESLGFDVGPFLLDDLPF